MTEPIYLTAEGANRLNTELTDLKGPQREALARRLRDAIQMGDLSENADYHKAKEDQGFLEGRIQEIMDVPLPRPRGDLGRARGTKEFADTRYRVWQALHADTPTLH